MMGKKIKRKRSEILQNNGMGKEDLKFSRTCFSKGKIIPVFI